LKRKPEKHEHYFGDSYDVVKQSLLRWLRSFGEWAVHPMLTQSPSSRFVSLLETFLNAKVISRDVLTIETDRRAYFSCAHSCGNLFLDPSTGLRLKNFRGDRAPEYLFASDLIHLTEHQPATLTIVFDQSVARGSEKRPIKTKLQHLLCHKISSFAYLSHACFVIAGRDYALVNRAYDRLIAESKLPGERFMRSDEFS